MTYLNILLIAALLCASVTGALGALSTSKDGKFQAIAQGPDKIALYWKTDESTPVISMNGASMVDMVFQTLPTGFHTTTVTGLTPNTEYTFKLGENGPQIMEKTWCEVPARDDVDLLILGGTASGVSAAVTAARMGMQVALVEDTNRVGGMASNGLGATDIRNMARANGFFEDFRQLVVEYYGEGDGRKYEPRVANAIMKSMLYEHQNIRLYLKSEAVGPIMQGRAVLGAKIKDLVSGKTGIIRARRTIDATYNADFAVQAGAPFRAGREARSECEPHAGVIYFDDRTQEILPGSTGEADNKQQSYSYLMIWKDYGEAGAPLIEKPRFYDPESFRHSPDWKNTWNYTSGRLPNGKYEINQHPFGTDWPGINHDYPTASPERRREIEQMYKDRALGYLYYMQNECGHKNLGLADDEFIDNDNFPVQLYVRESRRIEGDYMFSECDVTDARKFFRADSIAIGDYPMDSHATEELKDPTARHKGEGEMWLASFTPWYQTPYGVLTPKGVDNLIISTAVSGTHVGYGTLRMEPVRMALGQAAAAAAYWSILYSVQPRQVNPAWVQDRILSQYSYITWNSDVNRYTRHFKAINFIAARGIFVNEAFEPDKPLTREQTLVVLNRMLKLENYPRGMEISPLPSPQDPVTRGQFAQWLVDAKRRVSPDWQPIRPQYPSYSDVPEDSPYYEAIETLRARWISAALFEDYEPGKFKPDAPISRGDAAQAIYLAHRAYAMNYWMP